MLAPHFRDDHTLARRLLDASESYLRDRGAKVFYAGCISPLNPFYLGLYGGSELPGIMQSDAVSVQLFQSAGYQEIDRVVMMECSLPSFRAPVDRQQLQNRRRFCVELETDTGHRNWWDACSGPISESARFVVFPAEGGPPAGSVVFWIMEPLSTSYGQSTAGLTQLTINEPFQRKGLATFLNAEAMRQLQMGGLANVEVQTMIGNTAAIGLYQKLGFREYDQGLVMRKAA
jgi:ribosomal protein S18 acetylase RimI-like enzyme